MAYDRADSPALYESIFCKNQSSSQEVPLFSPDLEVAEVSDVPVFLPDLDVSEFSYFPVSFSKPEFPEYQIFLCLPQIQKSQICREVPIYSLCVYLSDLKVCLFVFQRCQRCLSHIFTSFSVFLPVYQLSSLSFFRGF